MKRIQFNRSRPLPYGARLVARQARKKHLPVGTPGYWGNPYEIEKEGKQEKEGSREEVIALFRRDVEALSDAQREAWLAPLRHVSALACWCKLDQACHADVLIEYLDKPT
jgi:hypothetical protein